MEKSPSHIEKPVRHKQKTITAIQPQSEKIIAINPLKGAWN